MNMLLMTRQAVKLKKYDKIHFVKASKRKMMKVGVRQLRQVWIMAMAMPIQTPYGKPKLL